MGMHRQLLDYLPQYMQDYLEIQKIMGTEQTEFNTLWDGVDSVWNNQFLQDATVEGVTRWERMLGITPKLTDTLAERKFRIFSLWNQELPYTMTKLQETLTTLCGVGGFSIVLSAGIYHIEIKLALGNKSYYSDVENILNKMLPANLTEHIQIMYNTHEVLHEYKHSELSEFTHYELRNEVIE